MKTRLLLLFSLVLVLVLLVFVPAANARVIVGPRAPQPALLVAGCDMDDVGHIYAYTYDGISLGEWQKGGPELKEADAICYGPKRAVIYVLHGNDQVDAYSASTGLWIRTLIPEGAFTDAKAMIYAQPSLFLPGVLLISANEGFGEFGEGGRVMAFDAGTGKYLRDVVKNGAAGLMSEAMALAFGPNGTLYVGNDTRAVPNGPSSPYSVMMFRLSGLSAVYGGLAVDASLNYLQDPNGMAFGPDGKLYISWEDDNYETANFDEAGAIMRYDPLTGIVDEFVTGQHGQQIGFTEAFGMTFSGGRSSYLYVGSGDTAEIFVFNKNGGWVTSFPTLSDPKGLLWIGPALSNPSFSAPD